MRLRRGNRCGLELRCLNLEIPAWPPARGRWQLVFQICSHFVPTTTQPPAVSALGDEKSCLFSSNSVNMLMSLPECGMSYYHPGCLIYTWTQASYWDCTDCCVIVLYHRLLFLLDVLFIFSSFYLTVAALKFYVMVNLATVLILQTWFLAANSTFCWQA